MSDLEKRVAMLERKLANMIALARGPKGEDGRDGKDGKDGRDGRTIRIFADAPQPTVKVAVHVPKQLPPVVNVAAPAPGEKRLEYDDSGRIVSVKEVRI